MSDSDGLGFGFSSSSRRHGIHLEPHEAPAPPPEPLTPGSTTAATATTTTTTGDATPSTSPTAAAATAEANRSWIIYVLGGSYPENHPILTTPSLFTDSPTYEDMLLLSSLLGPAKPPVAAAEDVASAPGLLRVIAYGKDGTALRAVAAAAAADEKPEQAGTDIEPIPHDIAAGERCLVCLCDYAAGDEARRLVGCGHLFHRECIDEVSPVHLRRAYCRAYRASVNVHGLTHAASGSRLGATHARCVAERAYTKRRTRTQPRAPAAALALQNPWMLCEAG